MARPLASHAQSFINAHVTLALFALAPLAVAQNPASPARQQSAPYPTRQASDIRPLPAGVTPIGPQGVAPAAPGFNPAAQPIPPMPQQPEWAAKMSVEEQKWIDDVLKFWETRSDKVKIFECKFRRWDYDGGFVDPATGKRNTRTFAEGSIKYAQPDKGLYHVERLIAVMPPAKQGDKPQEVVQNPDLGEHWVCDGEKIYSFEANKKQVSVSPLPAEMRGKAIADGPLPFMFGAKAESIKARYWIRGLVADPNDKAKQDKYWLEAVPKSREDAQNFKMVRIVLDKKEYLPESLEIFAPNYDPPRNDARQSYLFLERVAKDENMLQAMVREGLLGAFHREFYEPRIPTGWTKVVQSPAGNVPPPQQAGPAPPPRGPLSLPR